MAYNLRPSPAWKLALSPHGKENRNTSRVFFSAMPLHLVRLADYFYIGKTVTGSGTSYTPLANTALKLKAVHVKNKLRGYS
jgi:hypothetical protein